MSVLTVPAEHFVDRIGGLPSGVEVAVWDPEAGDLPAEIRDRVEVVLWPDIVRPDANPRLHGLGSLKLVQLQTAGFDHILSGFPDGVTLANGRDVHTDETAEWAVTLLIAIMRGLPGYLEQQREQTWRTVPRRTFLAGSRVVVLGAGAIGSRIATLLRGFKAQVTCIGRTTRSTVDGVPVVTLEQGLDAIAEADGVIVIVPLSDETRGLLDSAFLGKMKDDSFLVNVARGAVVDTAALISECSSGRITAALDVTDPEPLPQGHPLWTTPNVYLTPHVGGEETPYAYQAAADIVTHQVNALAEGGPLINVVKESSTPRS